MCCVREQYLKQGFSNVTVDILMNSWRPGTVKQYGPVLRKWEQYCGSSIDPFNPTIPQALDFLSSLYQNNCGFDTIKNARSALSTIITPINNITFGKLPIVKRYIKGIFERRPTLPKNYVTWDVNILFTYLRSLPDPQMLPLKELSQKLALLMSIISGGQRVQTI